MDAYLKKLYYSIKEPQSFTGEQAIYQRAKAEKGATRSEVRRFLRKQDAYSRHYPVRKKFSRNRVRVYAIDEMWQADLVDVSGLSKSNRGFRFLLTCVDVLSKFAFAIPLKNKTSEAIINAFKQISTTGRMCQKLYVDRGSEFTNRRVRDYFGKKGVQMIFSTSDLKAQTVERWNRTLKSRMWKYFTAYGTSKYVDVLNDIVAGYNNSKHRSHGYRPVDVCEDNFKEVWRKTYGCRWPGYNEMRQRWRNCKYKFSVGDDVRISRAKSIFDKGYKASYSREIFTIYRRIPRRPPVYKLRDENGEDIIGIFYEPELVRVYL